MAPTPINNSKFCLKNISMNKSIAVIRIPKNTRIAINLNGSSFFTMLNISLQGAFVK